MLISYALATLSHRVILPGLSRRTGEPCRVVSTRHLVLAWDDDNKIQIIGCLDPRGKVYRVAVRDIVAIQKRLLAHAEQIFKDSGGGVIRTLEKLAPASFSYDGPDTPYTYCSLGIRDAVKLIGTWPSRNGDITAQMLPICGMLIPAADSLVTPYRQIGHLWTNGDFARPSGSEIVSYVKAPGVLIIAAKYPLELAARIIVRNSNAWGGMWRRVTSRKRARRLQRILLGSSKRVITQP